MMVAGRRQVEGEMLGSMLWYIQCVLITHRYTMCGMQLQHRAGST